MFPWVVRMAKHWEMPKESRLEVYPA
jgi:hypothetical protein